MYAIFLNIVSSNAYNIKTEKREERHLTLLLRTQPSHICMRSKQKQIL